jgi:filamentous hemagglutinin family protein
MVLFFRSDKFKRALLWTALSLVFGLNAAPLRAQQVAADGTLKTLVTTQDNLNFTITNGTRSGQNLFHSFREFSIPKEGSAIFDLRSSPAIDNIFSRVTGDRPSNINGLIQTIGGNRPNVFLLNPNGILFGNQARLDIGGSFLGTTAQGIQFDNGILFTNGTMAEALLNVRVPTGVQMGLSPATIQVEGKGHGLISQGPQLPYQRNPNVSNLQVRPDKTLALLGGEIMLNGGVLTAGNVELGSPVAGRSGGNAFVGLQPIVNGFTFDYAQVGSYGNIQLLNQSLVDISRQSAGTMKINAQDLQLKEGSLLQWH